MKKIRTNRNSEEEYWKSFTDIMAGLLLIVVLVMALLFLYLTQVERQPNPDSVSAAASADSRTIPTLGHNNYPSQPVQETYHRENENNLSGGGGGQNETRPPEPTEAPTEGREETGKAAVFVTVVDEETGNAIKKAGITFELYTEENRRGGLKKLNTYYPEKIEYSSYETTESGTFYLPEKLSLHKYSLHNLTAPASYEAGENVNFEIDAAYDWPEPYLLKIPLAPAKNVISVRTKDSMTGEPVKGYTYEVIANEDITTLDGSLRYAKDQIVDEFVTDDKGNGESIELYLGAYRIRQKSAPEFYAVDNTPLTVKVESKEDIETSVNEVRCDKTTFEISLTDEYSGEAIRDAVYSTKNGADITTDANGAAYLTELSKETAYELTVKSLPSNYKTKETKIRFRVDENGLIDAQAHRVFEHTAYVTRLELSVKDRIIGNDLSGESITVFDESGAPVVQADTNGTVETVTGLEPGTYTVRSGDKDYAERTVLIRDEAKPAEAYVYIWTYADFTIIFLTVLLAAAGVAVAIVIIRRRRGKKTNAQRKTES